MNISDNVFFTVTAVLPVLFLLTAILCLNWGVAKAAPFGMLIAAVAAILVFRAAPGAVILDAAKGAWSAATILLVIWPAIFSYELTCQVHGFDAIRGGIRSMTEHELLQILILGWVFPSFLQGITGFGVAVAVGAPLLLSIGVKPLYSIVVVLLCHIWGSTYGTLALAWSALIAQAGMTDMQNAQTAVYAAAMLWGQNLLCVLYCTYLYGRLKAIKEMLPAILLLSLIMGGGEMVLAPVNSTVACFLPTALGLLAVLALSRTKRYRRAWRIAGSRIMVGAESTAECEAKTKTKSQAFADTREMTFHQAFLPYYALTVITSVCLLIPPVNTLLGRWRIGFAFPQTVTGYGFVTEAESLFSPMKPLTYAGTFLALSAFISFIYYKKHGFVRTCELGEIWHRTVRKCMPTTIAILTLVIMSRIMTGSGMIYVLAQSAASSLGHAYILIAPFLGMLGAFITSSSMSSNILMGGLQKTAADLLEINPVITVSLQAIGAVLGNAFAPGCVIMGLSTTGYTGRDSDILKQVIPISIACAVIYGVIALATQLPQ